MKYDRIYSNPFLRLPSSVTDHKWMPWKQPKDGTLFYQISRNYVCEHCRFIGDSLYQKLLTWAGVVGII